jgi:hypothetical protein
MKRADNDVMAAHGMVLDCVLRPDEVKTVATEVVERIMATVQDSKKVYAFVARRQQQ